MDNSEFVNQYIETSTKMLHDFLGRNLVLDTKATVAEKALASLQQQHEELTLKVEELQRASETLEELKPKYEEAVRELEQAKQTIQQLTAVKQECDDMRSRYDALVQEAESLRVNYDSVRNDLGIARDKIAQLDKQNEEILQSNQELRNMFEQTAVEAKPAADPLPKKKPPVSKEL